MMYNFGDKVKIVSEEKLKKFGTPRDKFEFANTVGEIIDFQERRKNGKNHKVYVITATEKLGRKYTSRVNDVTYDSTGYIWYEDELSLYSINKRIVEVQHGRI